MSTRSDNAQSAELPAASAQNFQTHYPLIRVHTKQRMFQFCLTAGFTSTRRGAPVILPVALAASCSETLMLFTTRIAPAVLAIRVAAPLCCITLVVPVQVATPSL